MVAIKDMEMPKNCADCRFFHFYFDLDGAVHFICKCENVEMHGNFAIKRHDICPLIESEVNADADSD